MQTSFSELEYTARKKQTRRDRFLNEIEVITPWTELEKAAAPYYPSSNGRARPPIGLVRMLRMYVVQQCFGLSDEGAEDALYDSQAIRRFVGVDLSCETTPDATTLLNFRYLLETHQLTESIFNTINAHLAEKGLFLREGMIVDATLIAAASSTKNKDGKREENRALPVTWHVAMRPGKRKALSNTTEGELLKKIEHTKASIRAKVEHPFHVVKNLFRHCKARYQRLAKNTAQLFSLFGLANLMLARRWLLNVHTQGAF